MTKDALSAHSRDELGISEATAARPVQAAMASAATFTVGAAAPLLWVVISPASLLRPVVAVGSLLFLALLGMIGAKAGGAGILRPTIRVMFWGALAMALTTGIGALFGAVIRHAGRAICPGPIRHRSVLALGVRSKRGSQRRTIPMRLAQVDGAPVSVHGPAIRTTDMKTGARLCRQATDSAPPAARIR